MPMTVKFLVSSVEDGSRKEVLDVWVDSVGRPLGTNAGLSQFSNSTCAELHAYLYARESGELHINDMNTKGGTWVNGTPVKDEVLHPGDVVQCGDLKLFVMEIPR